jgi:hypothetical protein
MAEGDKRFKAGGGWQIPRFVRVFLFCFKRKRGTSPESVKDEGITKSQLSALASACAHGDLEADAPFL